MPAADGLTLGAVGLVVLLVSLPCLRDFAVRENERDARRLLPLLAELVERSPAAISAAETDLDLEGLFAAHPAVVAGLPDARAGGDGRTLRHHGYVFAGWRASPGAPVALIAWPFDRGRTGKQAYLYLPGRGLFEHENPLGRWNGTRGPGPDELDLADGWSEPAR
jgi:hypothetical protein